MDVILQTSLPNPPWLDPKRWRLPGVQPLPMEEWLIRDDVFDQQMALRDHLIETRSGDVHALLPSAKDAADECFDTVLSTLAADPEYQINGDAVTRPDGVTVPLRRNAPLLTLGRLIQADLCLMEAGPDGHVLTGAVLCFPAYWTLSEKIGRALPAIHGPVTEYNTDVSRRVQRLFDAMQTNTLLCRMNANLHVSPCLFTPKRESDPDSRVAVETGEFVRSERQVLRRLPRTRAIVFSIHTYMVAVKSLSEAAKANLKRLSP